MRLKLVATISDTAIRRMKSSELQEALEVGFKAFSQSLPGLSKQNFERICRSELNNDLSADKFMGGSWPEVEKLLATKR